MSGKRDAVKVGLPIVLLIIAGFVVAFQFVKPAPPSTITLAAGPKDGTYYVLAQAFVERLAREGITLHVLETAGTAENLELLTKDAALPKDAGGRTVDVALVQSGVVPPRRYPDLRSLGSLYLEPLWIFTHGLGTVDDPAALGGRRLFLGTAGSGTRALALRLLAAVGVEPGAFEDRAYPSTASAAAALTAGELDALFAVVAPEATIVKELLSLPEGALLSWRRAGAVTRNYPYLSEVAIPEGTLDLVRNLPAAPVTLVAASANLVVHKDLHPALQELLVIVAGDVPAAGSLLTPGETFPAPTHLAFPLSEDADHVYKRGPSFLLRLMPFWAASLVNRFLIMLVPLLTLAVPLFRMLPPVYRWRVRSRIYRWYRDLLSIEREAFAGDLAGRADALDRLDAVEAEAEVRRVQVPLSYADELYNLHLHIRYLRDVLKEQS